MAYICSDHFNKKDFHYSYEFKTRKQLHSEAVPMITYNASEENATKTIISYIEENSFVLKNKSPTLNYGETVNEQIENQKLKNENLLFHSLNNGKR